MDFFISKEWGVRHAILAFYSINLLNPYVQEALLLLGYF